jgi:hypothetical protein
LVACCCYHFSELILSRNIHSLYSRSPKTQVDHCILETNEFLVFIILE